MVWLMMKVLLAVRWVRELLYHPVETRQIFTFHLDQCGKKQGNLCSSSWNNRALMKGRAKARSYVNMQINVISHRLIS